MTKDGKVLRYILIPEPTGVSSSFDGILILTIITSDNALHKIEKYFPKQNIYLRLIYIDL